MNPVVKRVADAANTLYKRKFRKKYLGEKQKISNFMQTILLNI